MTEELKTKYHKDYIKCCKFYSKLISTVSLSSYPFETKVNKIINIKELTQKTLRDLTDKYKQNIESNDIVTNTDYNFTNKKSLHIGINYFGTSNALNGCINDVDNIVSFITDKCGFSYSNVKILTDNTLKTPTKANILEEFTNLLKNSKEGELLFFTYSGHGTYTIDLNNDEQSGYDQALVSLDMQYVLDDEIKSIIDAYLPENVTLFALIDACYSGSSLDLHYQYFDTLNNNFTTTTSNTKTKGKVIMISGSNDKQTSADAYINGQYAGAMTWSLLSSLKDNFKCSWNELIESMRSKLSKELMTQIPQLSSGNILNVKNNCVLTA